MSENAAKKAGRPKGAVNKLCEQSLAIFEGYQREYNWEPLSSAIELARRLENECKELDKLADNLPLVKEFGSSLRDVMCYKYSKFKAVEINMTPETTNYLQMLHAAINLSDDKDSESV